VPDERLRPDEPLRDEYAFLREPSPRPSPATEGDRVHRSRRGREIALGVVSVVIAAGVVVATVTHLPSRRPRSTDVKILPTTSPTTARLISQSPVPPAKGAPFPVGTGVLRHSGGPYRSRARVAAGVLAHLECTLGTARRGMPGFTCARVDIAFFDRYADAWKLRGASWALVHSWAVDREMYVVTVWGHLPSAPPRAFTEITTVLIDATTGRTMMEGGPPLPAADANR
jgi:hypothetical protein